MSKLAICAFATLLVAEGTMGTAAAQRGRGGATGRMASAPATRQSGAVGRPAATTSRSSANSHVQGGYTSTFAMRPQRHVVVAPFYPGLYPGLYPGIYPGLYSPYAYSPYRSYAEPYAVAPYETNNQTDLLYQVERLTREVERLRQEHVNTNTQPLPPAPQPVAPSPAVEPPPPPAQPAQPIILVFRDGHRVKIQNYAIVRDSVWVLDNSTRIALNELDVDATQQANPGRVLLLAAK